MKNTKNLQQHFLSIKQSYKKLLELCQVYDKIESLKVESSNLKGLVKLRKGF